MDRWYWTETSLLPGEINKFSCSCKRLYDGDERTAFEDGSLSVTNTRLLWKQPSKSKCLGLALATVVLVEEESGSFISSAKLVLHLSPRPSDQPAGPIGSSTNSHIKMALKQSDLQTCVHHLNAAVADRAWESASFRNLSLNSPTRGAGQKAPRAGILGIERALEAKQQAANQSISAAFEDLKQLMTQAKEMVALSHNIAARIKEQGHDSSSDETTQFRSCLLSLGIDDPVTRDAVGSTNEYHRKLAGEIASALETPVREAGGVMLLSEVYCRINRARGLELLSPEDVSNACSLMKTSQYPLTLQTFQSGVQVLQLSSMNTEKLVKDTRDLLEGECGGRDGFEVARLAGLPLLLAKERLLLCEREGAVLRDESSQGLNFFPNYF
ncbi:EAP30, partial [Trinorchestia longiramus]